MFKKLRIKIIIIIISVITILFSSILISIYVASYQKSKTDTDFILRRISRGKGFEKLAEDSRYHYKLYDPSKLYLVLIMNNEKIVRIANHSNSGYTNKELGQLALRLSHKKTFGGTIKNLTYMVTKRNNKTFVAFLNNSLQTSYLDALFYNILTFGIIGLVLLLIISIGLSKWLVMPIELAFLKQKQFISDASHELKTPVAIIAANADVIQREIGESKWLHYINTETSRMNKLITDLLELATIDTKEDKKFLKKINLSETVLSIVLPFESIAFEKQINLNEQIENGISIVGDVTRLGQLTSILIDNAFNHTEKGGCIIVKLKQQYSKKILTVSNTGNAIPVEKQELIFERFYRADEARTRGNGNYGLGLSIAKAITRSYNGKISVACKNNWTTFKITL